MIPDELAALPAWLAAERPLVTVIGDVILDGWWSGRTERMSREAPAPVVEISERRYAAGGAANTAVNLAALGARVRLAGVVGDDEAGHRLRAILEEAGVDLTWFLSSDSVRTTSKNRVLAGDQMIVRVDDVSDRQCPPELTALLARAAVAATEGADAELVCDYGSGVLDAGVLAALAGRPARPALCVVDAHDPAMWAPLHPDIVTPNAEETARLTGAPLRFDTDRAAAVALRAQDVLSASGSAAAVVTLDRDGTVVLDPHGVVHNTRAQPALEKQASGAGDTFVAALTLARACGVGLALSASFAQAAADVVVQRFGTSVCSTADLAAELGGRPDRVLDLAELTARLAASRAEGKRIVFTNGCFDVLHRGHTSYLRQARDLGEVLVVGVNDDDSVRRLKGPGRPVNAATDRAAVLASLGCVDYVTVFASDTPIPLLERLRPDVYAKGGDYTAEMLDETGVVRAYGGEVSILDYVPHQSTTAVVERIRAAPGAAAG